MIQKIILLFILAIVFISPVSAYKWVNDSSIVNGLGDIGNHSTPCVFNDSGTWKLISGNKVGDFDGFEWNGTSWISNSSIVNGLGDIGNHSTPTVFNDSGTWKLISGNEVGDFDGFEWNGTSWISNSSIVNGLIEMIGCTTPTVFNDNGIWKLISGDYSNVYFGYVWNGVRWVDDYNIVDGLYFIELDFTKQTVFNDNGIWKFISGGERWESQWIFKGAQWNGAIWVMNSSIVNGLSDVGEYPAPTIYDDSGTWKLISGNGSGLFNGFYLNSIPTVPTSIQEPDYHLNQSITVQWLNSIDSDGNTITYDVKVGTTTGATDILNENVATNISSSFNVTQFDTYYWSVRSNDSYEVSSWSTEDIFSVTNTVPAISNVTISPDPIAVEDDLLALNNTGTDIDGDSITLYYKWYKNSVLQSDLTTSLVNSSNTSDGELWKVGIIPNDGYENGTEIQSQTVEIGSTNSAPTLTGVNINITYPMKKYVNFTIISENANDVNGDSRKLEIGSATGLSDLGIGEYFTNGNESNIIISMPFYDGLEHTLYIRLNDSNLTSQEYQLIITSDITKPVLNSESLSSTTGNQGDFFGITINTTSINSTISTVTVNVLRPDATSTNWTMSNTVNDTWYYNYITTADVGTYIIQYYTITDASDNIKSASSSLSFVISLAENGGTGGGGGGTITYESDVEFVLTPSALDVPYLYRPFMSVTQQWYYIIDSNLEIDTCEVDDIFECEITEFGTKLKVSYVIDDDSFTTRVIESKMIVKSKFGDVITVPIRLTIYNFGVYINVPQMFLGTDSTKLDNILLKIDDNVNPNIASGIRLFPIFVILFMIGLIYLVYKKQGD